MSNPRPAEQWYSGDWFRAVDVLKCDWATVGIWRQMLDIMTNEQEIGKIKGTIDEICQVVSCKPAQLKTLIELNKRHNFADVTVRNGFVTIVNRRMNRAFLERQAGKLRVQKFRNKKKQDCNAKITPLTSTNAKDTNSTSFSNTNNRGLSGLDLVLAKAALEYTEKIELILGPFNPREQKTFRGIYQHLMKYAKDRNSGMIFDDAIGWATDKIDYATRHEKEKVDARRMFVNEVKKRTGYKGNRK